VITASILSPIENGLEHLLLALHTNIGLSWAWSIIALTALVRLVIFPITAKQTRSSLAMQRLAPYQKQLQAKYKDDRAALNQAMMEFYRDNKVNPLASCLPLLIQIPIFLSLFFVLRHPETFQGHSQDFSWLFGFVDDIRQHINNGLTGGAADKFVPPVARNWAASGWILLVVYVGSQLTSTLTMMTSPNPQQKWLFMAMPVLFVPFILKFPVGVMLYWITTNLWSLGQYLLVVRFTDTGKEVVLPADSKGRKKVVGGQASNKAKGPAGSTASGQANARRNKRRK
jgi:YidC/Oxa1 family membrane protein insertase